MVFALALVLTIGVTVCNSFRLRRFQREFSYELHLKANRPKPRPRGRFVRTCRNGLGGFECLNCGVDVPEKGHTVKQCEERLEQERAKLAPSPPEEAHDPPMDKAPGAEEPSHDD